MKCTNLLTLAIVAMVGLLTTSAHADLLLTPIEGFNPNTYFDGNFTAGIDFDDDNGAPDGLHQTQAGFTSVPNSNNKIYEITNNGITFDIVTTNATQNNTNRYRGSDSNTRLEDAGDLMIDFEQWWARGPESSVTEAAVTISGLIPNAEYEISVLHYNIGSNQQPHSYYDGASSAAPLLGEVLASGSQDDHLTWNTGGLMTGDADNSGEIVFTILGNERDGGPDADPLDRRYESRVTLNGISVYTATVVPEPGSLALLGLGGVMMLVRRRR